jgi:hypothetical protein
MSILEKNLKQALLGKDPEIGGSGIYVGPEELEFYFELHNIWEN